jgi:hypothetical protein
MSNHDVFSFTINILVFGGLIMFFIALTIILFTGPSQFVVDGLIIGGIMAVLGLFFWILSRGSGPLA